jgi:uncharacterized membrane protein
MGTGMLRFAWRKKLLLATSALTFITAKDVPITILLNLLVFSICYIIGDYRYQWKGQKNDVEV